MADHGISFHVKVMPPEDSANSALSRDQSNVKPVEQMRIAFKSNDTFRSVWSGIEETYIKSYGDQDREFIYFSHLQDEDGADISLTDNISMLFGGVPKEERVLYVQQKYVWSHCSIPPGSHLRPQGFVKRTVRDVTPEAQESVRRRLRQRQGSRIGVDESDANAPVTSRVSAARGGGAHQIGMSRAGDDFLLPTIQCRNTRNSQGAVLVEDSQRQHPASLPPSSADALRQRQSDSNNQSSHFMPPPSSSPTGEAAARAKSGAPSGQRAASGSSTGQPPTPTPETSRKTSSQPPSGLHKYFGASRQPNHQQSAQDHNASGIIDIEDPIEDDEDVDDVARRSGHKRRRLSPPPLNNDDDVDEPDSHEDTRVYDIPTSENVDSSQPQSNAAVLGRSATRISAVESESGKPWSIDGKKLILKGLRGGYSCGKMRRVWFASKRSESAIRNERNILKRDHPNGRVVRGHELYENNTLPDAREREAALSPPRSAWNETDTKKFRNALADGYDLHEIHEMHFHLRTQTAMSHKLERLKPNMLKNEKIKNTFPSDDIQDPSWNDDLSLKLRRAYNEGIGIEVAHGNWFSGVPRNVFIQKMTAYRVQMGEISNPDGDSDNDPEADLEALMSDAVDDPGETEAEQDREHAKPSVAKDGAEADSTEVSNPPPEQPGVPVRREMDAVIIYTNAKAKSQATKQNPEVDQNSGDRLLNENKTVAQQATRSTAAARLSRSTAPRMSASSGPPPKTGRMSELEEDTGEPDNNNNAGVEFDSPSEEEESHQQPPTPDAEEQAPPALIKGEPDSPDTQCRLDSQLRADSTPSPSTPKTQPSIPSRTDATRRSSRLDQRQSPSAIDLSPNPTETARPSSRRGVGQVAAVVPSSPNPIQQTTDRPPRPRGAGRTSRQQQANGTEASVRPSNQRGQPSRLPERDGTVTRFNRSARRALRNGSPHANSTSYAGALTESEHHTNPTLSLSAAQVDGAAQRVTAEPNGPPCHPGADFEEMFCGGVSLDELPLDRKGKIRIGRPGFARKMPTQHFFMRSDNTRYRLAQSLAKPEYVYDVFMYIKYMDMHEISTLTSDLELSTVLHKERRRLKDQRRKRLGLRVVGLEYDGIDDIHVMMKEGRSLCETVVLNPGRPSQNELLGRREIEEVEEDNIIDCGGLIEEVNEDEHGNVDSKSAAMAVEEDEDVKEPFKIAEAVFGGEDDEDEYDLPSAPPAGSVNSDHHPSDADLQNLAQSDDSMPEEWDNPHVTFNAVRNRRRRAVNADTQEINTSVHVEGRSYDGVVRRYSPDVRPSPPTQVENASRSTIPFCGFDGVNERNPDKEAIDTPTHADRGPHDQTPLPSSMIPPFPSSGKVRSSYGSTSTSQSVVTSVVQAPVTSQTSIDQFDGAASDFGVAEQGGDGQVVEKAKSKKRKRKKDNEDGEARNAAPAESASRKKKKKSKRAGVEGAAPATSNASVSIRRKGREHDPAAIPPPALPNQLHSEASTGSGMTVSSSRRPGRRTERRRRSKAKRRGANDAEGRSAGNVTSMSNIEAEASEDAEEPAVPVPTSDQVVQSVERRARRAGVGEMQVAVGRTSSAREWEMSIGPNLFSGIKLHTPPPPHIRERR